MSPNQLIPSQPYTLSYFITDHTDVATYYVRARIYDASTGELLDTQNLTAVPTNTHLFSKVAQAPGDPSGHGRRIVVVATAYSDAGYTTKSTNYAEQSENYIVAKAGGGLLGGGGFIDHNGLYELSKGQIDEMGKHIMEALDAIESMFEKIMTAVGKIPTEKVELAKGLQPLADILKKIDASVSKIPTDKVTLDATHKLIEKALVSISDLHNKESQTDFTSVHEAIAGLKDHVSESYKNADLMLGAHMSDLHTALPNYISGKKEEPKTEVAEVEEDKQPELDVNKLL